LHEIHEVAGHRTSAKQLLKDENKNIIRGSRRWTQ